MAQRPPGVLLAPLGATEQHGPHLPLDTDTVIAEAWADRVAARLEGAVVAPTIPYGSSGEHQSFPGTISIGREALALALIELVRSATVHIDRVVFLVGHGGNLDPVGGAVRQLRTEGHNVDAYFPRWQREDGPPIDAHAGRTETSLMLHLRPERVRVDRFETGHQGPLTEMMDDLVAHGVAAVSPNGVLGDPTEATAEEGVRLLDDLVARTVSLLRPTTPSG